VQDAFLSAFRNMQNFDGKSKLSTWLHRIVINSCLMKLRTKRRKPSVSIETLLPRYNDEGHMELPIQSWRRGETGNADDAPDDSLRQRVREEIETLPEEYRAVLMLRDVEDLDTAETAVVLGVSESAVKTRLHRARQALRSKLDLVVRGERSQEGGK
jgi:RNA polymerase sigma-70 factor, ECF subfamily